LLHLERDEYGESVRFATLIALVVLGGCSWILPRPSPPSSATPAYAAAASECSLELVEARKTLTQRVDARGLPALLVMRDASRKGPDRLAKNGDAIYFQVSPPRAPETVATWIIEAQGATGQRLQQGAELTDGVTLQLQSADGSGYLRARRAGESASSSMPRGDATSLIVYKADTPDPARPTTCDARLRDGDYVFLRATTPAAWINVSAAGIPYLQSAASTEELARVRRGGDPGCLKGEQRCYTDQDAGLVCAWVPSCAGSP
jgi:hypothetical protein